MSAEITIKVPQGAERVTMLGLGDRNLKMIREVLGVNVAARESSVRVSGERGAVTAAQGVLEHLGNAAERQEHLTRQQVMDVIGQALAGKIRPKPAERTGRMARGEWGEGPTVNGEGRRPGGIVRGPEAWGDRLDAYAAGEPVRAKTPNQQRYLDAIRDYDLVFGIGPAGTGKTYLAVAAAVHLLKAEQVKKLILVRPAVEAGERLGFLPGDLQAKVNPYLRPLLDALHDMMDFSTIKRFMFNDVVEVVPLAYMRGRTLNNAVIILDEAQNTTRGQMQMFLTRMGQGSKMIVTGDTTQIDLPDPLQSGLIDATRRLAGIRGIAITTLSEQDIVRHELVQRVVEAYARRDEPAPTKAADFGPPPGDIPAAAAVDAASGGR